MFSISFNKYRDYLKNFKIRGIFLKFCLKLKKNSRAFYMQITLYIVTYIYYSNGLSLSLLPKVFVHPHYSSPVSLPFETWTSRNGRSHLSLSTIEIKRIKKAKTNRTNIQKQPKKKKKKTRLSYNL